MIEATYEATGYENKTCNMRCGHQHRSLQAARRCLHKLKYHVVPGGQRVIVAAWKNGYVEASHGEIFTEGCTNPNCTDGGCSDCSISKLIDHPASVL